MNTPQIKTTPAIQVTGCRVDCPNTLIYDPNQEGETLGCIYKYGSLPKTGFPEWCPLSDEGEA